MKRKPSQQLTTPTPHSKEIIKRLRSPQAKRLPLKKAPETTSVILQKHKGPRSREDPKADSNNTTASTKPRPAKPTKKQREKSFREMGENEIMSIINSFAAKIQRQWRVHVFRKRLSEFMAIMQAERKKQAKRLNSYSSSRNNTLHQAIQFEEDEISSGTTLYDRQKYDSFSSIKESNYCEHSRVGFTCKSQSQKSLPSSKHVQMTPRSQLEQSNSQSKTPRQVQKISSHLSKSLQRPNSDRQFQEAATEVRRASFNVLEQKRPVENRRHSTGELPPKRSVSEKQLQIGKAYEIVIEQAGSKRRQGAESSPSRRSYENEGNLAFKKGSSMQKMMQKCKKQLEITKLKQLLSVENRYSKNEVTHHNYIEIVDRINRQHSSKLEEIKSKEGRLRNALGELLDAYKTRFLEDDPQPSHLDVSLSFDKWDFNSSAKKSFDHFDCLPENNSSKVLSIESVLRELEEEDAGITSDEKRFKKNKSLQMIEAIAQRSKEISEKDVASFQENPVNMPQTITIRQPEDFMEQAQLSEYPNEPQQISRQTEQAVPSRVTSQSHSFQCQQQTPEKDKNLMQLRSQNNLQEVISSPSLLITPAGAPELVRSQEDVQPQVLEADLMRQLIFQERKPVAAIVDFSDPLVTKLRELVIEKILMTNIKMINSIKFIFAKAGEEKKKRKAEGELPIIDTDINAVNTWLLEISHFVLDSYQQVLRDNLLRVKQPPITEVLAMARRGLATIPTYQTIPEYIYKDFEFYFIKTLQKTYNVTNDSYGAFSSVVYTFHRALVDALNEALMEELATGKDWISTPWKMPKKFKTLRGGQDQVKLSLERSINVVSNWAEYGLGRLVLDEDFSQAQYRQFQEEKIKLVGRQEILNEALNPTFSVGKAMLEITEWVYQQELSAALYEMLSLAQE